MFSLVLMTTSCKKEDLTPDPQNITKADLVGNWDFVSLKFDVDNNGIIDDDETYTDCNQDLLDAYPYDYVTLSFLNIIMIENEGTLDIHTDCVNSNNDPIDDSSYTFTFSNNIINCENGAWIFEIQNIETFFTTNPKILVLKVTHGGSFAPNSIYTLEKRIN